MFCVEHRTYKSHGCANADHKDTTVHICPVCAMTVKAVFGEDAQVTMKRHSQTKCDPSNYNKVMKKPRCPVRGCRELLTFSNKVSCTSCQKTVCIRHRYPTDHSCGSTGSKILKEPARSAAASKFLEFLAARGSGTDCGSESSRMGSLSISEKKFEQEKTPTIKPWACGCKLCLLTH